MFGKTPVVLASLRRIVLEEARKPKVSVVTLAGRTVPCEVHAGGLTEAGARVWHARPVDRDLRRSEAASIVHDPFTPLTGAEVVLVRFACEHHTERAPRWALTGRW